MQNYRPWEKRRYLFQRSVFTFYMRILRNYILIAKIFFYDVNFEKNTSKIKNQRLICKTTDLQEDLHTVFNGRFRLFLWKFSEIIFLWQKLFFLWRHFWKKNIFSKERSFAWLSTKFPLNWCLSFAEGPLKFFFVLSDIYTLSS